MFKKMNKVRLEASEADLWCCSTKIKSWTGDVDESPFTQANVQDIWTKQESIINNCELQFQAVYCLQLLNLIQRLIDLQIPAFLCAFSPLSLWKRVSLILEVAAKLASSSMRSIGKCLCRKMLQNVQYQCL